MFIIGQSRRREVKILSPIIQKNSEYRDFAKEKFKGKKRLAHFAIFFSSKMPFFQVVVKFKVKMLSRP